MQPWIAELKPDWPEHLCLPRDNLAPVRGYLSEDPQVDAALQRVLVFGPAVFLLLCAPWRIARLRKGMPVVIANRRGSLKAVSAFLNRNVRYTAD